MKKKRDKRRTEIPESYFVGELNVIDNNVKICSRRDQSKAEGLYINSKKIDFCFVLLIFMTAVTLSAGRKILQLGAGCWQVGQERNRDFNFSSS